MQIKIIICYFIPTRKTKKDIIPGAGEDVRPIELLLRVKYDITILENCFSSFL